MAEASAAGDDARRASQFENVRVAGRLADGEGLRIVAKRRATVPAGAVSGAGGLVATTAEADAAEPRLTPLAPPPAGAHASRPPAAARRQPGELSAVDAKKSAADTRATMQRLLQAPGVARSSGPYRGADPPAPGRSSASAERSTKRKTAGGASRIQSALLYCVTVVGRAVTTSDRQKKAMSLPLRPASRLVTFVVLCRHLLLCRRSISHAGHSSERQQTRGGDVWQKSSSRSLLRRSSSESFLAACRLAQLGTRCGYCAVCSNRRQRWDTSRTRKSRCEIGASSVPWSKSNSFPQR